MRKFMVVVMLVGLGLGPAGGAYATPVYVSCEILREGESWGFDATLNESESSVSVTKGGGFNGPAQFSPTEVRFVEQDGYGSSYFGTTTFITIRTIDRTDLSATLEWKVLRGAEIQDSSFIATGQCELVDPPERVF